MTEYQPGLEAEVAFPPQSPQTTLAEQISKAGLKQAHIAETDKYAHVTFFFNGGRQEPYLGEDDILVASRKDIKTHDLAPEMKAKEIADKAVERINAGDDFLVINFANADIVGHTANMPAIIKAVETIDAELKKIVGMALAKQGIVLITADHGNAETNIHPETGDLHTAHTTNLVPFILVSEHVIPSESPEGRRVEESLKLKIFQNFHPEQSEGSIKQLRDPSTPPAYAGVGRDDRNITLRPSGSLADVAPTILELMNLKKPQSMTGQSLIAN